MGRIQTDVVDLAALLYLVIVLTFAFILMELLGPAALVSVGALLYLVIVMSLGWMVVGREEATRVDGVGADEAVSTAAQPGPPPA